ncbi:site-2 protease family protein [Streptomyces sp. 3MP-14]|uniref:Site-2 protease family protein n=1 Tax=Streptomyces mimosae TaxID=2586635 RepID=A0A5N6A397_9ACTN|nr:MULTISPECIES: site-2 protease family protein [Streptomyces]KAB8162483.1 site-2 protease family protein [Streptomyces mimosae]KAB8174309.1 site-2 protease family protein [Streptomyces sp. 3MP-14]
MAETTTDRSPDPENPEDPENARNLADPESPEHRDAPDTRDPRRPRGALLVGRVRDVPIYVTPSWFLVAALITLLLGHQLDRALPELGQERYLVALFFAVAFYGSVLVHELAHTYAALRLGLPVHRVLIQFIGGASEIDDRSTTPRRDLVVVGSGPLLSLVLAGVFALAMLAVEPGTVPGVLVAALMISNLIVAVFNLLPGLPLDGGRMLRAVIWWRTGDVLRGTVVTAWTGRALALVVLVGFPTATQLAAGDRGAFGGLQPLLDALLAAVLAAIIWLAAGRGLSQARRNAQLPSLTARALTRRAIPVPGETSLAEGLRRANEVGAQALIVVDDDGAPLALVREAGIAGVPDDRRPWVPVIALAEELTDGMRVPADLTGEPLLDHLDATPASEYLVVEENGEVYGVLSYRDVDKALLAMERRRPAAAPRPAG